MTTFSRALTLISVLCAMLATGCAETPQAKAPTGVAVGVWEEFPPPPCALRPARYAGPELAVASSPTAVTTSAAPPAVVAPPAPAPVAAGKVFMIELDAAGRTLTDGDVVSVAFDRMIFLRDSRMSPDCSNVAVTNLFMKSMGSICQVGILPLEQGLKPGEQVQASWKVGGELRSFSIKVMPLVVQKAAENDSGENRWDWRQARSLVWSSLLFASR